MTTYTCKICSHTKTQKGHITSHLKTKTHQKSVKIFKLNLEKLSEEELVKEYSKSDIDAIITELECVCLKPREIKKILPTNEIIWRVTDTDLISNQKHEDIKSKTFQVIKKCHDILYSSSAIVGVKAQNDIMKLLALKLLEPQFNDESSDLYKRCIKLKEELDEDDYENYMSWCQNIDNITKNDDDKLNEWLLFVSNFLVKILPEIYTENDKTFSYKKDTILVKIIKELSKININQDFFDAFGSTCGDVHEMFRAYGKSSKELGQFFTPRKLINVIFHGIKDLINPKGTVYDPCMGTGGFLTRIQKLMNIDSENIYGCEMEPDTAKYGQTSIYLNSGKLCPNIRVCNSLSENEYIPSNEFDTIITNPPFGTKMKYKDLEESYTQIFSEDYDFTFKDAYPIVTNNGACLFIQHCINTLKKGGVCAIVLPAGELFEGSSKGMVNMRKWLCDTIDIQSIMKVPGGAFDHTGVKTNVLMFKKNGGTKQIKFLETNDSCTEVKEIATVSYRNIKAGNYNLGVDTYLEKPEAETSDIPMVELGEICYMKNGTNLTKARTIEGEYPVIGGGQQPTCYHNEYNRDEYTILCSSSGAYSGYISCYPTKVWASDCFSIIPKNERLNNKYLFYILKSIQDDIYKLQSGSGVPHVYERNLQPIKIPLPPIEVQEQIVDFYDNMFSKIAKFEEENKEKNILKIAILNSYLQ